MLQFYGFIFENVLQWQNCERNSEEMNKPLSNYAHEGKHDILEAIWVIAHQKDNIDPDKDIL